MTITSPVYWGWVNPSSAVPDSTLSLLTRIRRGDDIMAISSEYPELSAAQLTLAKSLQAQEVELNRLYKQLQRAEAVKINLERELTSSFLRERTS